MTNRAPLNRAIFRVSQAIGLVSNKAVAPPEEIGDGLDAVGQPADEVAVEG